MRSLFRISLVSAWVLLWTTAGMPHRCCLAVMASCCLGEEARAAVSCPSCRATDAEGGEGEHWGAGSGESPSSLPAEASICGCERLLAADSSTKDRSQSDDQLAADAVSISGEPILDAAALDPQSSPISLRGPPRPPARAPPSIS